MTGSPEPKPIPPVRLGADVFVGDGEMARLMREKDWAATQLGPVEAWPQSLRTAVNICLDSRYPIEIWWGPDYLRFYNDAYRPILGASKHPQFLGRPGRECWAEVWDVVGPMLDSVRQTGVATWSEDFLLTVTRNGYTEETYFTFSYSPLRDESGGVAGIFCACNESTRRVLGERRLKTLRELDISESNVEEACHGAAQVLGRNLHDLPFTLIYLLDESGTKANLVGQSGWEHDSPAAPPIIDLQNGQDAPWPLPSVIETGLPQLIHNLDQRFPTTTSPVWPEPTVSAILMPLGRGAHAAPGTVLIAGLSPRLEFNEDYRNFVHLAAEHVGRAIANARAREDEQRKVEALAALDRAKTAFFGNVSHEFRTPLTLMLRPIEDALQMAPDSVSPSGRELLAIAHRNGLRLQKLVNTLLEFSRAEAGRTEAHFKPTDLGSFTAELASNFRSATEKAGLQLVVNCPTYLEPVYVDRDMWEKIVLNLISNAFKFTFEGDIRVSLERRGHNVELSVRDTGIGISPEQLPRIFDRFHRVEGAPGRTHEGSGIGLALVTELVKLHGGSVWAESAVGQGSTFTVSIPLGYAHLPEDRLVHDRYSAALPVATQSYVEEALRWIPAPPPGLSPALQDLAVDRHYFHDHGSDTQSPPARPRIVVADDNSDMRDYLRNLLGDLYDVTVVPDGQAAIEAVRTLSPDLLLSDVMMPKLDGFGLVRTLRNDPANAALPIILLSARAGEESRVEGLSAGVDDYLVKPFSARELLARIAGQLKIAVVRREAADRERQLRHAAEVERTRWADMLEQAPALIAVLRGPDHVFEVANSEYLRFTGRTNSVSLIGKPIREALPEIAGQGFYELLDRVYQTGEPHTGNAVLVRVNAIPEGGIYDRFLNFVYQPSRNLEGTIDGIFVHAVDVTELVLARQRIEESEHRFRRLAESLPQIVWTARSDGEWDYANERWYDFVGAGGSHDNAPGWSTILHPDDLGPAYDTWRSAVGEGTPYQVECRLLDRKTGVYHWHLARAVPVLDDYQNVVKWFGTFTDIDGQKRTEEDLRRANEDLRQFAYAASHDLQEPLRMVTSYSQMLIRKYPGPPEGDAAVLVKFISEGTRRMRELLNDLLAYTGVTMDAARADYKVDLNEVFGTVLENLRTAIDESGASVTSDRLPPLLGQRPHFIQLLQNLIGNAIKYHCDDPPVIHISAARLESDWKFSVTDNGIGIDPQYHRRIFGVFKRLHGNRIAGTGIGLAICQRIVHIYGGQIWVESDVGQGATFHFTLPIGKEA